MKLKQQNDILAKWEIYTPQQKEIILSEFRKKLPEDYYCKTTLLEFLTKKANMEDNKPHGFEDDLRS